MTTEERLQELLSHYQDRGVASAFCQDVLGTLVAYDRTRNADLLQTLRVYFHCNGNAVESAERLFLHRNSLLYRLQRIEEINPRAMPAMVATSKTAITLPRSAGRSDVIAAK